MAKLSTKAIGYVTCKGCIFLKPIDDFKGHGHCSDMHVRMTIVIETPKQCIWKQHGEGQQAKAGI